MKKLISFILCLVTVVSVIPMGTMAQENPFPDVPADAWYAEYIVKANEMGLMQGNEKGEMMPTKPITRAEAVEILYNNCDRLYDYPEVTEIPFTDVKKSDWFYDAVKWAYCEGFIQGVGNNKFKPNDYVTRQDFVVMIQRYYNLGGLYILERFEYYFLETVEFKDSDEISDYANWAVSAFTGTFGYKLTGQYSGPKMEHIMTGYNGYFMPKANCSRAEASKILVNFLGSEIIRYVYKDFSKFRDIPYSISSVYILDDIEYGFFYSYWKTGGRESDFIFGANEYITRSDLAKLVVCSDVLSSINPKYDKYSFTDYEGIYANLAEYAYRKGFMLLRDDGTFAPDDYVTVEEAIYFINRFNELNDFTITVDYTNEYSDFNEVSPEYKNAVKLAVCDINRKNKPDLEAYFVPVEEGKILPQSNITRLQFFKMIKGNTPWKYYS